MTEPVVPIRAGVTPALDAERELIDYCAMKVREFTSTHGAPASRIALVLMGKINDSDHAFAKHSWDMLDSRPQSEIRGHAALLLLRE